MVRRALIILGYVVGALFVVAFTIGLVAYGNDYTYDFKAHRIVQKGHVIIQSVPSGVRVTADGKLLGKKTPYQAVYSVGSHLFNLAKDGYHTWTKTLEVTAGQVSLANYVLLVPNNPPKTPLDTRSAVVSQSISKDHRHLAYVAVVPATATAVATTAVYTLDLGNPKPVRLYTAKAATSDTSAESLQSVVWSDDASHLLIRSTVGDQTVYRLAAASGGEPVDLTDQYKFDFSGLAFSANNWRQLYWVSPDGLRRLDVDSQSVSAVLADKVAQFWPEPDRVLYVQQTDLGRSLWSLDSHGKKQELIQALPESDSYSVAFGNYSGHDELAVVPSKTGTGTLYSDILGDTSTAKILAHSVTTVSFSPDNHLVVFSSASVVESYDLERSLLLGTDALYTFPALPNDLTQLTWFDNYHVLMTRGTSLYFAEYDGANAINLGSTVAGQPAQRSSDFKSVLMLQPDGQSTKLVSLQLRQ